MDKPKEEKQDNLVKSFDPQNRKFSFTPQIVIAVLVVALVGAGLGFFMAQKQGASTSTVSEVTNKSQVQKGATYGSNDTKTFKDTAEGVVKDGGINGEGQYHLVRPGGDSQNVYMTSSSVDLSLLTGRKIKVWGQTQKAQYAGWLMDVGRVEVLE